MQAAKALDQAADGKGPFKGWHALIWFAGFFGFMFAVNGIFLWTAITTFPGEDVQKSYLTGLTYNQELDRRAHQEDAGWVTEIGVSGAGSHRELTVRLLAKDGAALPASEVTAEVRHPADRSHDRAVSLLKTGAGEFVAPIGDVAPGLWTVIVTAEVDPASEGPDLRAAKKVHLP